MSSYRGSRLIESEKGFSLIEVLVASLIMGLGIVSVGNLMPKMIEWETAANMRIRGTLLASSRMDYMQSMDYSDILAADNGKFTDIMDPEIWGANVNWRYSSQVVDPGNMKRVDLFIQVKSSGSGSSEMGDTYVFYVVNDENT